MQRLLRRSTFFILFSLSFTTLIWSGYFIFVPPTVLTAWAARKTQARTNKPVPTVHFSEQEPTSAKPVLTWTKVEGAVAYEIELLTKPPENTNKPVSDTTCLFSTKKIYVNGFNADLSTYFKSIFFTGVCADWTLTVTP